MSETAARSILDTSIVIAENVEHIPGHLAVSAATLAELHFGVLVAKTSQVRAERLRRLSVIQTLFKVLPLDELVATSYGLLANAVVESGRQPRRRVMDLIIAATAHAHGAALYTRNPDDFVGLEHLIDIRTA